MRLKLFLITSLSYLLVSCAHKPAPKLTSCILDAPMAQLQCFNEANGQSFVLPVVSADKLVCRPASDEMQLLKFCGGL